MDGGGCFLPATPSTNISRPAAGMNTGIGDAVDLGWKLAATFRGIGGPELLAAYESERRPVGLRNREASAGHTQVRRRIAQSYRDDLVAALPISGERRAEISAGIAELGNAENESYGIDRKSTRLNSSHSQI